MPTFVEILDAVPLPERGGSAVRVRRLDIDPAFLGKRLQLGTLATVDTTDSGDVVPAVAAAYSDAQIFDTPDKMGDAIQALLVQEGLRAVHPMTGEPERRASGVALGDS